MPPQLLAAHARSLTEVRLTFDAPIVVTTAAAAAFTPREVPGVIAVASRWSVDGAVATVVVQPELSPRVRYAVTVAGVTDAAGAPIGSPTDRAELGPVAPRRPVGRVFELWQMLPQHARASDDTGDLARFVACLQDVVDLLLADQDAWPLLLDLTRAPEPFVDAMLLDLGNPFPPPSDVGAKRRLAASLVGIYQQKGTGIGITNAMRLLFGIGATSQAVADQTMSLGDAELGVDWVLGPSSRWARYAFDVAVSRVLTDEERRQVRAVIEYMAPAHTHFVNLVEPGAPPPSFWWILGDSELGEASALQ
jgi:phage tail-like protein